MEGFTKLIAYLIPITVLILLGVFYFYSPETGFVKLKAGVSKVKDYLPNITFGSELTAGKIFVPMKQKEEILELNKTIDLMLKSGSSGCFANYDGFSSLGEERTSIIMTYNPSEDATEFSFLGGAGGKQIVTNFNFKIKGMVPCVIAGSNEIATNFFDKFINKKTIGGSYYLNVGSIKIYYATDTGLGGTTCSNGNRIMVPELGSSGPNYYCNNFEDSGWIFTPDNRHICFFPTNAAENADEHGIDNDYVSSFGNQQKC